MKHTLCNWVPMSGEAPDVKEDLLLTVDRGYGREVVTGYTFCDGEEFFLYAEQCYINKKSVLAWATLPLGYEGE